MADKTKSDKDDKDNDANEKSGGGDKAEKEKDKPTFHEETPVETHHELFVRERKLSYKAVAGRLPLKNHSQDDPDIEAQVFFTYYALDPAEGGGNERPLTFAFNGGPGSASVWVHLGGLGPQRVYLNPDGSLPPPPYRLLPNEHTWLSDTDLVFIDPVGTGYSRAKNDETAKKYYDVDGDIASIGEFIRLFLTRYERWASPLFLAGESYGTTRAAGLAGHLIDRGIAFSGIMFHLHSAAPANAALQARKRVAVCPVRARVRGDGVVSQAVSRRFTGAGVDRFAPRGRSVRLWPLYAGPNAGRPYLGGRTGRCRAETFPSDRLIGNLCSAARFAD